jgi:hypothetical protein
MIDSYLQILLQTRWGRQRANCHLLNGRPAHALGVQGTSGSGNELAGRVKVLPLHFRREQRTIVRNLTKIRMQEVGPTEVIQFEELCGESRGSRKNRMAEV